MPESNELVAIPSELNEIFNEKHEMMLRLARETRVPVESLQDVNTRVTTMILASYGLGIQRATYPEPERIQEPDPDAHRKTPFAIWLDHRVKIEREQNDTRGRSVRILTLIKLVRDIALRLDDRVTALEARDVRTEGGVR